MSERRLRLRQRVEDSATPAWSDSAPAFPPIPHAADHPLALPNAGRDFAQIPVIQPSRQVGAEGGPMPPDLEEQVEAGRGGGTALDAVTASQMGQALGGSFSDVRIHADAEADRVSRGIGAVAFTTGSDIFFRQDAYQPEAAEGRRLLAHELTHVEQQRGMRQDGPMTVGPAGDGYEQEAEATEASVARMLEDDAAAAGIVNNGPETDKKVRRRLAGAAVQRIQDEDATPPDSAGAGAQTPPEPVQQEYALSAPEPITVPAGDLEPGDYPTPGDQPPSDNSNVAYAKRLSAGGLLQRDGDDAPTMESDVQAQGTGTLAGPGQVPWTIQTTAVYRNFNLAQIASLHLDLGHEPSFSLIFSPPDPSAAGGGTYGLSTQAAITLVNWHWMPPWNNEVEIGLQGFLQNSILPQVSTQLGGQAQVEQHILPWFSVTLNAGGAWTPPQNGRPGVFGATAGGGVLFHAHW